VVAEPAVAAPVPVPVPVRLVEARLVEALREPPEAVPDPLLGQDLAPSPPPILQTAAPRDWRPA
jgi:hypothetical protein